MRCGAACPRCLAWSARQSVAMHHRLARRRIDAKVASKPLAASTTWNHQGRNNEPRLFQFPARLAEQVRAHAARPDRSVGWVLTTVLAHCRAQDRGDGCAAEGDEMKTTRNSPRARKERARQAVLRLHRLTERELIAPKLDLRQCQAHTKNGGILRAACSVCRSWRLHHRAKRSGMGRPIKDLNPFGRPSSAPCSRSRHACCWSEEGESQPPRSVRCQTHVHRPINHLNARPDALGDCAEAMIHFGLAFNVCPDRKRGRHPVKRHGLVQPSGCAKIILNPIGAVVLE